MSGKAYSGKDRILCALNHEKADRLPVFDIVNKPDLYEEALGESNFESRGRLTVRLGKHLGMDAVTVHSAPYTCLIPPRDQFDSANQFTDRFGIVCRVDPSSWPLASAINPRELEPELLDVIRNTPITDADTFEVKEAIAEADNDMAVFGSVRSAFSFLSILLGLENLSYALYESPELLREVIEAADDYWTRLGLQMIEHGCTALYVANDLGMNNQTLLSPAHLREFFFPSLRKQIQNWKQAGGRVLYHSCGNINAVLEDLADMGIDAINNIQVKAGMDLASVKQRIGDRVTIVGNVDATGIMCQSDQALITEAIQKVIDIAGQDGALIIATDHSFHEGIPAENVYHFIRTAVELGAFNE